MGSRYLSDGLLVHVLLLVLLGLEGVSLQGAEHLLLSAETVVGPQQSRVCLLRFQHSNYLISGLMGRALQRTDLKDSVSHDSCGHS